MRSQDVVCVASAENDERIGKKVPTFRTRAIPNDVHTMAVFRNCSAKLAFPNAFRFTGVS